MPVVILKWIYIRIVSNILYYTVRTLRVNRKWWVFKFSIAFVQVFLVMLFIFIFLFYKNKLLRVIFQTAYRLFFPNRVSLHFESTGPCLMGSFSSESFSLSLCSKCIVHHSCHIGYSYNYLLDHIYSFPRSKSTAHACILK